MKKKTILIICLFAIALLISSVFIYKSSENRRYEEKYNSAFTKLFVEERNQVLFLYQAVGLAIEFPDETNYKNVLETAKQTESVCVQTYGELSNLVETYGVGLVYYATFFRDIKAAATSVRDIDDWKHIYNILEKILALYDDHSNPVSTSEKIREMDRFYESLSLLNEEMMLEELND